VDDFTVRSDGRGENLYFGIQDYSGDGGQLDIPNYLKGVAVKYIDAGAFKGKGLSSVRLPQGLYVIQNEAFADNQLTSVLLPGGEVTVGANAFTGNPIIRISIGNKLRLHSTAFDNDFCLFYIQNSSKAGTYAWNGRRWTYSP
jgi:hypothetical protein